ncbi:stage V sporulation protein AA [Saliterribacillus persicus]|uniref:Stage V sporulation protein AA n=1 Tax=Saliterribacillus persicus TaxID=930114 RepID=A0A368XA84_9BACI|nr:stage V sporulation protein AA [Saliterribacillus persicus]RCW64860.1 stage V sporulation protein AA [Saliterribacillus persicus]
MNQKIYIRLKKKIRMKKKGMLYLKDVSFITGDSDLMKNIALLPIYQVEDKDKNVVVLDHYQLLKHILSVHKNITIEFLGPTQVIIEIIKDNKKMPVLNIIIIWILLFIGSAMAIMNFHYDVSMQPVHQQLFFLLTNKEVAQPLWIQVPYSIGLGVGMILFFNHIFRKRINEEPSPLEIEMFKYQQDLDDYYVIHENKINNPHD